jgi:hypothetical protein
LQAILDEAVDRPVMEEAVNLEYKSTLNPRRPT